MGKKRLVIDMEEADHALLVQWARQSEMTVANYVRNACSLPLEHQGKKRVPEPSKKSSAVTARQAKRK
jgi:hypothetical protein